MMTDTEIAVELAVELISVERIPPFKFGIYYDAKKEPARVIIHKVVKNGTMGVTEFPSAASARMWCEKALKEGYTVERLTSGQAVSASISRRKRLYEYREKQAKMTPAEIRHMDDDIPFMYEWR